MQQRRAAVLTCYTRAEVRTCHTRAAVWTCHTEEGSGPAWTRQPVGRAVPLWQKVPLPQTVHGIMWSGGGDQGKEEGSGEERGRGGGEGRRTRLHDDGQSIRREGQRTRLHHSMATTYLWCPSYVPRRTPHHVPLFQATMSNDVPGLVHRHLMDDRPPPT